MKLRIARKIGKVSTRGRLRLRDNGTGHTPEQRRRAALRLHKEWWRRCVRVDDGTRTIRYDDGTTRESWCNRNRRADWGERSARILQTRERRRRNWVRNKRRRASGLPEAYERRAGFWPYDAWAPDGVRAAFALRGESWLPSWLGARP